MDKKELSVETQMLHARYPERDIFGALSMPVYHAVAYEFDNAEKMESAFTGRSSEHVYSRLSNPTVQYFERRVRTLTAASEAVAFNSGMAAIANTLITLAYAGANIVTSSHLFGNTYSLIAFTLKDFGVEPRFCDMTDIASIEKQIDDKTCAVFLETITNPQMEIADLQLLNSICKKYGTPLVADTTIVPFTTFKATKFGVDIEIVSTTKYISGGATSLGGIVMDYNTCDYSRSPKLCKFIGQSDMSAFMFKLRREIHRNLGACMTPDVATKQITGLETVSLRFERAAKTCSDLANSIQYLNGVKSVNYPGMPEHPFNAISQRQFGDYPGAMFTFDVASREAAFRFMNRLQLIRRATNLFDNKALAIHPASTIFGTFTEELRQSMDIRQNTIRISVGLEQVNDLYNDFEQALK